MASFNQVTLLGNVTRDPQLKFLPNQTAVAEFGLAMNRKFKTSGGEEKEEVCFVDCTIWGKAAEIINQYVTKGKPLLVSGRLTYSTWEDKQGGGKRSRLAVTVENFQFVGGRDSGGEGDDGGEPQTRADARGGGSRATPSQRPRREPVTNPIGDEQQFDDDSIPFHWEGRHGQPV